MLVRFGTGTAWPRPRVYGATGAKTFDFVGDWDPAKVYTGQQVRQDTTIGWGGGADVIVSVPLCAPVPACYLIINPGGHADGASRSPTSTCATSTATATPTRSPAAPATPP